jgi:hypothetical protein
MKYKRIIDLEVLIVHEYQEIPGTCMPGEEIGAIEILYRGKRYRVPLGVSHMILIDYLCRCRYPEDAWFISAQLQLDPFAIEHGSNAPGHQVRPARTSRTAVRQQIRRIRKVLAKLIAHEGLDFAAEELICSQESSTKSVRYFINAGTVRWEHSSKPISGLDIPRSRGGLFDYADGVRANL